MEANAQLSDIAAKLFWWQEPVVSLANQNRFLAQVMTLGTWQDVQSVQSALGWDAFRNVLQQAPPGVFDGRSWSYWHVFFGLAVPEMPRRSLT